MGRIRNIPRRTALDGLTAASEVVQRLSMQKRDGRGRFMPDWASKRRDAEEKGFAALDRLEYQIEEWAFRKILDGMDQSRGAYTMQRQREYDEERRRVRQAQLDSRRCSECDTLMLGKRPQAKTCGRAACRKARSRRLGAK